VVSFANKEKKMFRTGLIWALGMAALTGACTKESPAASASPSPKTAAVAAPAPKAKTPVKTQVPAKLAEIGVKAVSELLSSKTGVSLLDANNDDTRKQYGVVPGATLLSNYEDYKLEELPTNKSEKLVFYCANTHCSASEIGANKAVLAGYTDVQVMKAGIAGWVAAGEKTTRIQ